MASPGMVSAVVRARAASRDFIVRVSGYQFDAGRLAASPDRPLKRRKNLHQVVVRLRSPQKKKPRTKERGVLSGRRGKFRSFAGDGQAPREVRKDPEPAGP